MNHTKVLTRIALILFIIPIVIYLAFGIYVSVINSKADKSSKFIAEAIAKNDPTICEKVTAKLSIGGPTTSNLIGDCYREVAKANKNPAACHGDDFCLGEVAMTANNAAICGLMKPGLSKGVCYGHFAVQNKSISVCKGLTDSWARERCYISYIEENKVEASFCENNFQTPKWKQSCFNSAAQDARDEALCQKVDPSQLRNCINGVRSGYARF